MKTCPHPKCGSHKVIMFDSNNDLCQKCNRWFPAVKDEPDPNPLQDKVDKLESELTTLKKQKLCRKPKWKNCVSRKSYEQSRKETKEFQEETEELIKQIGEYQKDCPDPKFAKEALDIFKNTTKFLITENKKLKNEIEKLKKKYGLNAK